MADRARRQQRPEVLRSRAARRPIAHAYQLAGDAGPSRRQGGNAPAGGPFTTSCPGRGQAAAPVGQLNRSRVLVRGQHVEHWLIAQGLAYELGSPQLSPPSRRASSRRGRLRHEDRRAHPPSGPRDEVAFRNSRSASRHPRVMRTAAARKALAFAPGWRYMGATLTSFVPHPFRAGAVERSTSNPNPPGPRRTRRADMSTSPRASILVGVCAGADRSASPAYSRFDTGQLSGVVKTLRARPSLEPPCA